VPTAPHPQQLGRVAAGGQNIFHLTQVEAFGILALRAIAPFAVVTLKRSADLGELGLLGGVSWRGEIERKPEEPQFPGELFGQLQVGKANGFGGEPGCGIVHRLVGISGHALGVVGNEVLLHPGGTGGRGPQVEQALFGSIHEGASLANSRCRDSAAGFLRRARRLRRGSDRGE
jgi:hypothetical protein